MKRFLFLRGRQHHEQREEQSSPPSQGIHRHRYPETDGLRLAIASPHSSSSSIAMDLSNHSQENRRQLLSLRGGRGGLLTTTPAATTRNTSHLYPSKDEVQVADIATRCPLTLPWAKAMSRSSRNLLGNTETTTSEEMLHMTFLTSIRGGCVGVGVEVEVEESSSTTRRLSSPSYYTSS